MLFRSEGEEAELVVDLPPINVLGWRKYFAPALLVLVLGIGGGGGGTWWHLGGGDVAKARQETAEARAELEKARTENAVLTERLVARDQTIEQLRALDQDLQKTLRETQDVLARILLRHGSPEPR